MSTKKLEGKTALITGGSSGIGLATAKLLAAHGAKVIVTGRNPEQLAIASAEVGENLKAIQSDVSDLQHIDSLYEQLKAQRSKIDILFANAGIALMSPLEGVTEEFFDKHFNINVKGLFFTVQKALPLLNDGGSVILTGSVAGRKGFENFSVYNATKAAVRSFARSFANELKSRKIRVNAISPGPIETPIFGKMLANEHVSAMTEAMAQQVPLRRMGQASEIAEAVLFLASSDSSYINGIDLCVDGGMVQI